MSSPSRFSEYPAKVRTLLERFIESKGDPDAVRNCGRNSWEARSPLRDDISHSVSITYEAKEGRVLVHDHGAPERTEELLKALGLSWQDLFFDTPDENRSTPPQRNASVPQPKAEFIDIQTQCSWRRCVTRSRLEKYAQKWRVPVECLEHFDLGFDEERDRLIVFETNRCGQVIGAVERYASEHKRDKCSLRLSRRGLVGVYELGPSHQGALLVTEGFTDLLALTSLGFDNAIARPSCRQHSDLEALVKSLGCREVVIFSDQTPEERAGAEKLAETLADLVPTRVVIPPDSVKDLRVWIVGVTKAGRHDIEMAIREAPIVPGRRVASFYSFPVDCLPIPVRDLCIAGSSAMGIDSSMFAIPALVAMAGAVGNSRSVSVKSGWTEPCIVWAGIVSKSGTGKTPAQRVAMAPLYELDSTIREQSRSQHLEYHQAMEVHDADQKKWQKKRQRSDSEETSDPPRPPTEPPRKHLIVQNITSEALGESLADNPEGLVVEYDELTGWLNSFNAYRSGRGGDRELWLSIHSSAPIRVNRVGGREIVVPKPIVSIIGGVQPSILRRAIAGENTENGLAARFLFACPPPRQLLVTAESIPESTTKGYGHLILSLFKLRESGPAKVSLTTPAFEHFRAWCNQPTEGIASRQYEAPEALAASLAKLKGYAVRIALLIHLADGGEESLRADAMIRALTITDWFVNEAQRMHEHHVSGKEFDDDTKELIAWAREKHDGWVEPRNLKAGLRRYRNTPNESIHSRLDELVSDGHFTPEERDGRNGYRVI